MGQEEKNNSLRYAERIRIRDNQRSIDGIPRVQLESLEIKSNQRLSGVTVL